MTVDDVIRRVEQIRTMEVGEIARAAEADLYEDLLRAISEDECSDIRGCIRIALLTKYDLFRI